MSCIFSKKKMVAQKQCPMLHVWIILLVNDHIIYICIFFYTYIQIYVYIHVLDHGTLHQYIYIYVNRPYMEHMQHIGAVDGQARHLDSLSSMQISECQSHSFTSQLKNISRQENPNSVGG